MRVINRILWREARRTWLWLAVLIALMLGIVGLDAIAPWPFKILIDNVLGANPLEVGGVLGKFLSLFNTRELLGLFVIFIYFFSSFALSVVDYMKSILAKNVVQRITSDFSKEAFSNLQSMSGGFFKKQKIGDYIYRLSYDVSALGEFFEDGIVPLITSVLYVLVTATIMFIVSPQLTLISLAILPFLGTGLYFFNRNLEGATRRSEVYNSAAFSFIEEALSHLRIIQAFSQERRENRVFGQKMESSLKNDLTVYRLDFLLSLMMGIIIAISYSIIIAYGINAVFAGTLTTGLLVVFIFYLDNLTNPVLDIIYAAADVRSSYVKVHRMQDFFSSRSQGGFKGVLTELKKTDIVFRRVSLRGDEGKSILKNISFTIPAGKRTVIFGMNGSGKSSILSLMLRFAEASSGRILIGGKDLDKYNIVTLRDAIAFVPQEVTLFNDSIRNNIAFPKADAKLDEVRHAARLANAEQFILKLPGRYSFHVGEAGINLSGGQRQRLMLARAFVRQGAQILLFDEALSALDVRTRNIILGNIYEFSRGKTTILVSNIFDMVREADHVIVIQAGQIIYEGAPTRFPNELSLYRLMLQKEGRPVAASK